MAKSFLAAIFGLFLAYLGFNMLLTGIGITFLSAWISVLGINTGLLTSISIVGAIIGLAFAYFGSRLYFENEEQLSTLIFGILGLVLALGGAGIALGSGGTGLLVGLTVISIGLSFIGYAFKIKPLDPLTKITTSYKRLIGVRS